MKMHRLIAMLLVLSMLLLFAGCGGGENSVAAESSAQSVEEQAAAPAEEEAAQPETEEASAEETTTQREPSVFTGSTVEPLSYPVGDPDAPTEFSLFSVWGMGFEEYLDSWNSLPRLEEIQQATGCRLTFREVSATGASEQFNLMVVSGDLTDIIQPTDYYIGGLSAALDEDVIIDLTDIIEENAPIYYDMLMNRTNQTTIDTVLVNGRHLSMNTIKDEAVSDMGMIVRGDWLDELGLEVPETLDELTAMLEAFHNEYDCKQTLYVNSDAEIQGMDGIFGVTLFKIDNNTGVGAYVDNGVVKSGLTADEFREYLEYFNMLYSQGIIYADFYNNASTESEAWGLITSNETGMWRLGADTIAKVSDYPDDIPGAYGVPLPKTVKNEGDKYLMGSDVALSDNKGFSITSSCDEPEMVLQFWDWFFTDEGVLLSNYGIEGETFDYDANGTPQFNDMILDNPDGMNMMFAVILNTFNQTPMMNIVSKMWVGYTPEETEAIHLWSDRSNDDTSRTMPSAAALTAEETNQISNEMASVISVAQEATLKFMTGALELNDENWAQFQEDLENSGLPECLEVQQQAYDSYLRGERTIAVSSPGAPPDGGGAPPDGAAPEGPPPD